MRYFIIAAAVILAGCKTSSVHPASGGMAPMDAGGTHSTAAKVSNLAVGAKVTASSSHQEWEGEGPATNVTDGDATTRWSSDYEDNQSLTIDLGSAATLQRLVLLWEAAAPASYDVATSLDGKTWRTVAEKRGGLVGPRTDTVTLDGASARYLKLLLKVRVTGIQATNWGFSLYEAEIWGSR